MYSSNRQQNKTISNTKDLLGAIRKTDTELKKSVSVPQKTPGIISPTSALTKYSKPDKLSTLSTLLRLF